MHTSRRSLTTALLAVGVCLAGMATNGAENEEDEDEPPAVPQRAVQQFGPEMFDQWVFPRGTEPASRAELQSQLTMRISDLDQACQLSEPQVQKLQLAGRTEIKRLFDTIAAARRKFDAQRKNVQNANQIFQEIQPLRRSFTGQAFLDGSIFDKVAKTVLTEEQAPRYRRQLDQRRLFRRRAQRELLLLAMDKDLPLREAQREKMLALLEQTPPVNPGQYELFALWFVASKVPAEKYEEILDAVQWKTLQGKFTPVQNMEQWLRQNGALVAENPQE